jgi:LmbE family N-acetylglucosaminyl deacetylase
LRDLVADTRVIVIVAHYDDEVLFCGGLLAETRSMLAGLTLVVVTNIETTSAPRQPPQQLVSAAETERRALRLKAFDEVCRQLEAQRVELELPNLPQSSTRADPDYKSTLKRMCEAIEEQVLFSASDVVLTHGPDGEYGHPQHYCVYDAVRALSGNSQNSQEVISFGNSRRHDFAFRHGGIGKRALIDLYRDQGPEKPRWSPETDRRLKSWTSEYEWYLRIRR